MDRNMNFSAAPFKMTIPVFIVADGEILVNFDVLFTGLGVDSIALERITQTDLKKKEYPHEIRDHYIDCEHRKRVKVELRLPAHTTRYMGWRLNFRFLTNTKRVVDTEYVVNAGNVLQFNGVLCGDMAETETAIFNRLEMDYHLKANDAHDAPQEANAYRQRVYGAEDKLEQYRKAIYKEMLFLRREGGKKYRVTAGTLVDTENQIYMYSFKLESEVFLPDDAPVRVIVKGVEASGLVIFCEGFDLVVAVGTYLGKTIGIAHISAEPWKLLDSLGKKLSLAPEHRLTNMLLYQGPKLATRKPIKEIEKGQSNAKKHALTRSISLIWGPPGTGKTHVMAENAIEFLKQGKTVLLVSHSNVSVDGAALRVASLLENTDSKQMLKQGRIVRYGYIRDKELANRADVSAYAYALSKNKSLSDKLAELNDERDKIRNEDTKKLLEIRKKIKTVQDLLKGEVDKCIRGARLVATTVSKIYADKVFDDLEYDVVMFDEVSMAYVPQILCASQYARERFICVGDFRQLSPIVQSSENDLLKADIFAYLGITNGTDMYAHPWLVMLDEQRRMHPDIAEFSNLYVYDGLLRDFKGIKQQRLDIVNRAPLRGSALALVDMTGTYSPTSKDGDNSRFNIQSAILSVLTAMAAKANGEASVGIITPYAAQTRLVNAILSEQVRKEDGIVCATVHQFQGSERNVMIFDAVECYPSHRTGWLMSKNENGSVLRLINVAVTRARGKFITLAHRGYWKQRFPDGRNIYSKLLAFIPQKGKTVRIVDNKLSTLAQKMAQGTKIAYYAQESAAILACAEEIGDAKRQVVISIPEGKLTDECAKEVGLALWKAKSKGVTVLIKTAAYHLLPEEWKQFAWASEDAIFPLVMIDESVVWYGMPWTKTEFTDMNRKFVTVENMVFRLSGERTYRTIYGLANMDSRVMNGNSSALIERRGDMATSGMELSGIAAFVDKHAKCKSCGHAMSMQVSQRGRAYLKCPACQEIGFIELDFLRWYIQRERIVCPTHRCAVEAKLGQYGLYVKCEHGHTIKVQEI